MFTIIHVHHIQFLYEDKGYSLRKIVGETKHDFKTLQKYVEQQDFSLKLEKRKPVEKIDVYKEEVMASQVADLKMPSK